VDKPRSTYRYRLRNWPDYNAALVRRGSLTFWCDADALAGWIEHRRTGGRGRRSGRGRRGRPRQYSELAITTMLTLQAIYSLPLRATVGFVTSLLELAGHEALPVAHPSTLSRRRRTLTVALAVRRVKAPVHLVVDSTGLKLYGEGEWKVRQQGWTCHRRWLKMHLAVDEATSEIRSAAVSTNDVSDGQVLPGLLAAEAAPISQVTGDGIYDEWRCWDAVAARPEHPRAGFPPPRQKRGPNRRRARIRQHGNAGARPLDRDEHIRRIRAVGRQRWKQDVDYHRRSLAEAEVSRFKTRFGDRLSARSFAGQAIEVFIRCRALNLMSSLGMPKYRAA
jgi:hypothetical protein